MSMFSFRDWSLRRKMYFQFIGAVMPLVVVLLYQQGSSSDLPGKVNKALQAYNIGLDAADRYRIFLNGIGDAVDAGKEALGDQAKEAAADTEKQFKAAIVFDTNHHWDNALAALGRVQTAVFRRDSIKALMPLKADITSVKTSLDEFTNTFKKQLEDLSAQINEQQSRDVVRKRVSAGVTIGTLLMLALIIRHGINNVAIPVAVAVGTARRVAQGDLTGHIDVQHGGDELTELQRALRDMNRSLTEIVSEVRRVAQDVSDRTHTITDSNQDLAARMQTQSEQLTATAARIQSLLTTVARNAINAKQANVLARGAAQVADKGGHMVEEVMRTMLSIKDSSEKVVDIIGIIEDIAFQTNLLALNAAVEAARAGEEGKGFAVVAAEVGNLAKRSATTAKQIRDIIGNSVSKVKTGAALVAATGGTMRELVNAVSSVAIVIDDIENASRQQTTEAEQASRAIAEVATLTLQNSELVNETAALAEGMLARTEQLSNAVSKFKLYRHRRLQVPWRVQISNKRGVLGAGAVQHLSATGAFFESSVELQAGEQYRLTMSSAENIAITVECEVVRVGAAHHALHTYGVHFLRIQSNDKPALQQQLRTLFAQQPDADVTGHDALDSEDAIAHMPVLKAG